MMKTQTKTKAAPKAAKKKKRLRRVLILAALIVTWCCIFRMSPRLDAALSAPQEVRLNSTVTMIVTATNTHEKPVTLDSIDISDAFLEGFQILDIQPRPAETSHIPLCKMQSWEFGRTLDPAQSMTVTFRLKPAARGHFTGDIDITNPAHNSKTLYADIVVK